MENFDKLLEIYQIRQYFPHQNFVPYGIIDVMPLVINNLGAETQIYMLWTKSISRNQAQTSHSLVCAWFNMQLTSS